VPFKNTAESAKYISELKDIHSGSICSRKAAANYGLKILAENINYNYKNYTRFAILSKNAEIKPECNKISIVITVPHTPGSLYKALRYFEENNLNLTKIESRPLIDKPWQYYFYLDFEGNLNDSIAQKALSQVKNSSSYFKIFGNYCSHDVK
ncbi:MAG: bifunctional chorismate mutase/prephenate dehydratase, partial [Clostridia bacterium]|nr:bifunctional chorismate mutase/prephenate dehydratase [Clostridia bacterium]